MPPSSLNEWLAWQERLHPADMVLGLERVRQVFDALAPGPAPFKVVTVAGTNGKGSSVAMLESVMNAAGYRTGAYYSPHLVRYNERIRLGGQEAGDEALCRAFARVEAARGETPLTYFEFGTLAALQLFYEAVPDIVLLEVGLGGRLDAVNVLDSDVALLTAIDIDHSQWLGGDRERIGREKAGILRPGRPAVCSDPQPPRSVIDHAAGIQAPLACLGRDFGFEPGAEQWTWWGPQRRYAALPMPALGGAVQLQNAAGVLAVLEILAEDLPVSPAGLRQGLRAVRLPGRLQVLAGPPPCILDVAHNPHAARVLARALERMPCRGRTHAVFAMLEDKDITGVIQAMAGSVNEWHVADLHVARGATAAILAACLDRAGHPGAVHRHADPQSAYRRACALCGPHDRIVVFGSFHTVGAVLSLENGAPMTNTTTRQV